MIKLKQHYQYLMRGWLTLFAIAAVVVSGFASPLNDNMPATRAPANFHGPLCASRDLYAFSFGAQACDSRQGNTLLFMNSQMAVADSTPPVVYMIDDKVGNIKQLNPADIGSIEVVGKAIPAAQQGDTGGVVRIYTKKFIKMHPKRFPDQQMMRADTIKNQPPPENNS